MPNIRHGTGRLFLVGLVGLCGCTSGMNAQNFSQNVSLASQSGSQAAVHVANLDVATATAAALRLSNTITGGYMPTSDPLFSQMVALIQAGNYQGAAALAANSSYFTNYLARRMALEMQSPSLSETNGADNDATAFIIAHFVGTSTTKPSLSTLFSENATYMVATTDSNGNPVAIHAASLTSTQLSTIDWGTALQQVSGQSDASGTAIPQKHVGGFTTLSDRINDSSFAMYGATAGTNLRMIEGIYEVGTGLQLVDVESTQAIPQNAPRFVPEDNANFFHGQGQPACISCHGGGMSSLNHGYSTVADVFNFDPKAGFTYNWAAIEAASSTNAKYLLMKSLGSDSTKRVANAACNLAAKPSPVCNPDSIGADPNQGWDVSVTWGSNGVLSMMGWTGPTSGQGLNSLGSAIGQTEIMYQFMTQRVIGEICPTGTFSTSDIAQIAAAANPFASPAGTDDIRTIVTLVASNETCQ